MRVTWTGAAHLSFRLDPEDEITGKASDEYPIKLAINSCSIRGVPEDAHPDLYAVAYRTFTVKKKGRVQVWEEPLALGKPLPTLPLWISPELALPLDLDASYRETCEGLRLQS